jgi:hypothetical protein
MDKNENLFNNLKELNLPIGEYAIFGSGPMGIRDLREMHDIDIIITEKIYNEYVRKNGWEVKNIYENNDCFRGLVNHNLCIEMWKDWYTGWDIIELIKESEIIKGLPFIKLEQLLKWKKFFAKEKDLKDVEIIEKFLSTN